MAIFKPSNMSPQLEEVDLEQDWTISAQVNTSGEPVKAYRLEILNSRGDEVLYTRAAQNVANVRNKAVLKVPGINIGSMVGSNLSNGNNYQWGIRMYNAPVGSTAKPNTLVCDGYIVGSTKYVTWLTIPNHGDATKGYIESGTTYYSDSAFATIVGTVTADTNVILNDTSTYATFILSGTTYYVKPENVITYKSLADNIVYDRYIEYTANDADDLIIGAHEPDDKQKPTSYPYRQRKKIDWVTKELGTDSNFIKIETTESFDYDYPDGTEFAIYKCSDQHTVTSAFADPNSNINVSNVVLIYESPAKALAALTAGEKPDGKDLTSVFPSRKITGYSSDTGEIRVHDAWAAAPKNGYAYRIFTQDVSTQLYSELFTSDITFVAPSGKTYYGTVVNATSDNPVTYYSDKTLTTSAGTLTFNTQCTFVNSTYSTISKGSSIYYVATPSGGTLSGDYSAANVNGICGTVVIDSVSYVVPFADLKAMQSGSEIANLYNAQVLGGQPITHNYYKNINNRWDTTGDNPVKRLFIQPNINIKTDDTNPNEIVFENGARVDIIKVTKVNPTTNKTIDITFNKLDNTQWLLEGSSISVPTGWTGILPPIIPQSNYGVYTDFMDSMPYNVFYARKAPNPIIKFKDSNIENKADRLVNLVTETFKDYTEENFINCTTDYIASVFLSSVWGPQVITALNDMLAAIQTDIMEGVYGGDGLSRMINAASTAYDLNTKLTSYFGSMSGAQYAELTYGEIYTEFQYWGEKNTDIDNTNSTIVEAIWDEVSSIQVDYANNEYNNDGLQRIKEAVAAYTPYTPVEHIHYTTVIVARDDDIYCQKQYINNFYSYYDTNTMTLARAVTTYETTTGKSATGEGGVYTQDFNNWYAHFQTNGAYVYGYNDGEEYDINYTLTRTERVVNFRDVEFYTDWTSASVGNTDNLQIKYYNYSLYVMTTAGEELVKESGDIYSNELTWVFRGLDGVAENGYSATHPHEYKIVVDIIDEYGEAYQVSSYFKVYYATTVAQLPLQVDVDCETQCARVIVNSPSYAVSTSTTSKSTVTTRTYSEGGTNPHVETDANQILNYTKLEDDEPLNFPKTFGYYTEIGCKADFVTSIAQGTTADLFNLTYTSPANSNLTDTLTLKINNFHPYSISASGQIYINTARAYIYLYKNGALVHNAFSDGEGGYRDYFDALSYTTVDALKYTYMLQDGSANIICEDEMDVRTDTDVNYIFVNTIIINGVEYSAGIYTYNEGAQKYISKSSEYYGFLTTTEKGPVGYQTYDAINAPASTRHSSSAVAGELEYQEVNGEDSLVWLDNSITQEDSKLAEDFAKKIMKIYLTADNTTNIEVLKCEIEMV